jgi:hypothetical protein
MGGGNDRAVLDDHCADRHFARRFATARLVKREEERARRLRIREKRRRQRRGFKADQVANRRARFVEDAREVLEGTRPDAAHKEDLSLWKRAVRWLGRLAPESIEYAKAADVFAQVLNGNGTH